MGRLACASLLPEPKLVRMTLFSSSHLYPTAGTLGPLQTEKPALTQTPQFIPIHSDTSNPRASVTYTHMSGVLHLEEDSIWPMQ